MGTPHCGGACEWETLWSKDGFIVYIRGDTMISGEIMGISWVFQWKTLPVIFSIVVYSLLAVLYNVIWCYLGKSDDHMYTVYMYIGISIYISYIYINFHIFRIS